MNNEIKQILKNQQAIMMGLRELNEISLETSNDFLLEELGNTNIILNPKQFGKEENCCEMPKRNEEYAKSKNEETPLDLCSNCNHSRFDHTEKGEPIHCSYGGKGCGCYNFVENKDEVKEE